MTHVKVTICTGTTCFLMGGDRFHSLDDELPEEIRPYVTLRATSCLDFCKDGNFGKAPFVLLDDKVIAGATLSELVDAIRSRVVGESE